MKNQINFTENELRQAVQEEKTWADLKKRLKSEKKPILKRANYLGLDTSHLVQRETRKLPTPFKRSVEDYLSNKIQIQSTKLKRRLISEGILKEICSSCKNVSWLDQQIPLCLDHINGNPKDNSLYNLRLLCPNCHYLTPTFSGRNRIFFK